ncbi:PAS domain S-box protein [Gillisia sp. Q332]|uniref:sensor histidine kinase n=1 Tax=Gillisia xinjiangensis TaxID=3384765 RepID=UPI0039195493
MKQKKSSFNIIRRIIGKPAVAGFISFLFFLLLSFLLLWQRYQILNEGERQEMSNILGLVENNIEQSLQNSYSVVLSLALLIDNNGTITNFEEFALQLVERNPTIDAVQLVPNGVITHIYPMERNKEAMFFNILKDSIHSKAARKTIDSRKMYFAGPLELKQGGMAVVGRLPVFIKNEFWGFSAVIIKLDNLLEQAGIREMAEDKFLFQFSKLDEASGEEVFFLPEKLDMDRSFSKAVVLPDGDWKFYIAPRNTSAVLFLMLPVAILALLLSAWLGWIIYNLLKQPAKLQALVQLQAGELILSEIKFRTIFNQAAIGMARVNSVKGRILETNFRFQELLGYTPAEIAELNVMDVTHPDDLQEHIDKMKQLRKGKIREFSMQKRIKKKNGDLVWVNLTVSPLWSEGESPTTHIALIEDIHDKKMAETHLKDSYETVMEQNKRLLNFSYIVSHNLRSHSSNIDSILGLYEDCDDSEERENYISMLEKVSAALNQTLSDLNEVVSIQSNLELNVQYLKLKDYLDGTLGMLKVEIAEKQAKIYTDVPEAMQVKFNAGYMESVLLNLVTNSLRYSSPNRIPEIHIAGIKVGEKWMLEVKDNGIGIDLKKNRDKLFGLYKTFSNKPNARGVGLFITKNQIDAMDGSIAVESEPGEGTNIKVYFK